MYVHLYIYMHVHVCTCMYIIYTLYIHNSISLPCTCNISICIYIICAGCAEGFFKSGTGNARCEVCPTNQVSIANRTNCECAANHIGDDCNRKCCGACV